MSISVSAMQMAKHDDCAAWMRNGTAKQNNEVADKHEVCGVHESASLVGSE